MRARTCGSRSRQACSSGTVATGDTVVVRPIATSPLGKREVSRTATRALGVGQQDLGVLEEGLARLGQRDPRLDRSNRRALRLCSSAAICWPRAGCAMCSRAEAFSRLPASLTPMK
jgi:hypothetical protein